MILLDNTVLSNFALAGVLELLCLFVGNKGATTDHVTAEFSIGVDIGVLPESDLTWLKIVQVRSRREKALFRSLRKELDIGEASCLAIAITRKFDFLSDDGDARVIALREGVRLSGSIGVLLTLVQSGRIDLKRANNVLNDFIRHGYYSPIKCLDLLLKAKP
jgi:predicted nucleic acid-binding protein